MRIPVKLNRQFWPRLLTKIFPSAWDPRILILTKRNDKTWTKAVSVFKFGSTFKTTQYCRFPLTINILKDLKFLKPPIILDVGASDGSTSIHLMESLEYEKIYITDLNTEVFYNTLLGVTCFYDSNSDCILIATDYLIIYSDYKDAIFPLNIIAKYYFSKADTNDKKFKKIELFNPTLNSIKGKIVLTQYNIFSEWGFEKTDLIIVANVLNLNYFSENQIIKAAKVMAKVLNDNGRIAIIDNREIEKSTIFNFIGGQIVVEAEVNGGTEIRDLILSLNRI